MNTAVMTTNDVLARLKTFKESRQAEYSLRSLGIFGSFARGQAQEDSDVDVVFETSEPNLFRTSRMKQELEELLARTRGCGAVARADEPTPETAHPPGGPLCMTGRNCWTA